MEEYSVLSILPCPFLTFANNGSHIRSAEIFVELPLLELHLPVTLATQKLAKVQR